jgi:hypothetical protein
VSFAEYLRHGWKLVAITPGQKGPTGPAAKGWNLRERAISDPANAPQFNAGLCHAWSGTCSIDIDKMDTASEWLAQRDINLESLLSSNTSVRISSGRPGRAKLLYRLPTPLPSLKVAPYEGPVDPKTGKPKVYHALEFRCGSAEGLTVQDVLPPSIHPDTGRPYAWEYGDELLGHWSRLPELPAPLLALWKGLLAASASPAAGPQAPVGAELDYIAKVVNKRNPDDSYDDWLKVGMAIHHETRGSAAGLALWDAWSRKGAKYGETKPGTPAQFPADKWRTFKWDENSPVTLASLLSEDVAALEDFPVVPEGTTQDQGQDTRPEALMRNLLETRLVFVTGQDCYFDMAAVGEPWLSDRAVRHLFCPYVPEVIVQTGKGEKKVRPDPVEYLKNSRSKPVVDAVGLHPGEGRLYNEDGKRWVNRFFGKPVEPLHPKPFEREAFSFLWSRIKDETIQAWLLKFFGHAVQKPGVKIRSAPLLFSEATGTGKNTICKVLPEVMFGARWVRSMSGNVLASNFNDTIGEAWWLYLEELRTGGNKMERIQITNKIKPWITDSTIEVHPKGMKPYDLRNRLQVTASSNFNDAVHVDNNDRRWAMSEMRDPFTERETIDVYKFLESERAPGVLHHIFRAVDLTGFQPNGRAPLTIAKKVMIQAGLGAWESTFVEAICNGDGPFSRDLFRLKDVFEYFVGRGPTNIHAIRNLLQGSPFNCQPITKGVRKERLWAWRNVEFWQRRTEGDRLAYLQSGARPDYGKWTDEVPPSILALSADAPLEKPAPHPLQDLLGDVEFAS